MRSLYLAEVATVFRATPFTVTGDVNATPAGNVARALNIDAEFTTTVLLLVPITAFPPAVNVPTTVAAALNIADALTVSELVLLDPRLTLPYAVNCPVTASVLPIDTAAVEANAVTALTVKVWAALVPRIVLPKAVSVLAVLDNVTELAKVATPELSMVSLSVRVEVPAVVVLNTRLPPFWALEPESCSTRTVGMCQAVERQAWRWKRRE